MPEFEFSTILPTRTRSFRFRDQMSNVGIGSSNLNAEVCQ